MAAFLCKDRPLAILLFILATPSCAQSPPSPPQNCSLHVHVDNVRNTRGVIGLLLFATPEGWPEDVTRSVQHKASSIAPDTLDANLSFDTLSPGKYAVVALHDENANMKLDRNFIGWPKEGFGFSNNPRIGLAPASFNQALFLVQCPATDTTIHMVYK
ncbi:MAG TPA: DUF2141 domain-containing protein [Terracidiphilus sp.]|nr:DUF2141 domain-containing protein [Terracidiphilus sp.]